MNAREIWRSKTDEQVLEAFKTLADYTPEGREIIRSEMSRRNLTLTTCAPETATTAPDDVPTDDVPEAPPVSAFQRHEAIFPHSSRVVIVDVRMPFDSMVVFMIKWSLASIPAFIVLFAMFAFAAILLQDWVMRTRAF
jgi:hypothetical protein